MVKLASYQEIVGSIRATTVLGMVRLVKERPELTVARSEREHKSKHKRCIHLQESEKKRMIRMNQSPK